MIEIEDKIVSEELFTEYFCCDFKKCKGECCVEGDAGAPLEEEEITSIEENLDSIRPYMTDNGRQAVDKQGVFEVDIDGELTTTLVDGAECAYAFVENGLTLCAIERAYLKGEITYRKPMSCHLYPIRVAKFSNGTVGLNYHRWSVCSAAPIKGAAEKIKVYEALKEPLIRVFGETFYTYLQEVDECLQRGDFIEAQEE